MDGAFDREETQGEGERIVDQVSLGSKIEELMRGEEALEELRMMLGEQEGKVERLRREVEEYANEDRSGRLRKRYVRLVLEFDYYSMVRLRVLRRENRRIQKGQRCLPSKSSTRMRLRQLTEEKEVEELLVKGLRDLDWEEEVEEVPRLRERDFHTPGPACERCWGFPCDY